MPPKRKNGTCYSLYPYLVSPLFRGCEYAEASDRSQTKIGASWNWALSTPWFRRRKGPKNWSPSEKHLGSWTEALDSAIWARNGTFSPFLRRLANHPERARSFIRLQTGQTRGTRCAFPNDFEWTRKWARSHANRLWDLRRASDSLVYPLFNDLKEFRTRTVSDNIDHKVGAHSEDVDMQ